MIWGTPLHRADQLPPSQSNDLCGKCSLKGLQEIISTSFLRNSCKNLLHIMERDSIGRQLVNSILWWNSVTGNSGNWLNKITLAVTAKWPLHCVILSWFLHFLYNPECSNCDFLEGIRSNYLKFWHSSIKDVNQNNTECSKSYYIYVYILPYTMPHFLICFDGCVCVNQW